MRRSTWTMQFLMIISLVLIAPCLVPVLADTRTTPVTISTTGNTVKVDSSANTVKVDPNNNTVKAPTQYNKIQLTTTPQIIASPGSYSPAAINCAGYKEMRMVIATNLGDYNSSLYLSVGWRSGTSAYIPMGNFNFGAPANAITNQCNFAQTKGYLVVNIPIMSDQCNLSFSNLTGSSVTVSENSWVYLVN